MKKNKKYHIPAKYLVALQVLIVFLILPVAHSMAGCPENLAAYWHLEEASDTAPYIDSMGSHHGACELPDGCPSRDNDGVVGSSQEFDGSDGIEIPTNPIFDWTLSESFTLELWVKHSSDISSREILISRNSSTNNMQWWLGVLSSGVAGFYLSSTNNGEALLAAGSKRLDTGAWHHIAVVVNSLNKEIRLYTDSQLEFSQDISQIYSAGFGSSEGIFIGRLMESGNPAYNFNGTLDEIAIYDRVLTANEVKTHYYLSRDYCRTHAEPVGIMPLGDSITYDDRSGDSRTSGEKTGYRWPLWTWLDNSAYWIDFVGSQSSGGDKFPDPQNAGFPGYSVNELETLLATGPYLASFPSTEVVLLHIGTNDLDAGPTEDTSGIKNILDEIDAFNQHITVVLARIIERVTDDGRTNLFNNAVENMANNRISSGDKIIIVDMEDGANLVYAEDKTYPYDDGDMYDTWHPNNVVDPLSTDDSGYSKMADVWFAELENFLPQSSLPSITSTQLTTAHVSTPYSYDVDASGLPDASFLLTSNPPGMTIDSATGVIQWTPGPNDYLDYSIAVEAVNWLGSDQQAFTLSVNDLPSILSTPPANATEDVVYTYQPVATDRDEPPDTITWSLSGEPEGMMIDPATGAITWVPDDVASSGLVGLIADDGNGGTQTQEFTIAVENINDRPLITGTVDLSTSKNNAITISLNDVIVVDPDNIYPDDFTLQISEGENYQIDGNKVTPAASFLGTLQIPIKVNDGIEESEPFIADVNVTEKIANSAGSSSGGCFISTAWDN